VRGCSHECTEITPWPLVISKDNNSICLFSEASCDCINSTLSLKNWEVILSFQILKHHKYLWTNLWPGLQKGTFFWHRIWPIFEFWNFITFYSLRITIWKFSWLKLHYLAILCHKRQFNQCKESNVMMFCLCACKMCGKGIFCKSGHISRLIFGCFITAV